MLLDSHQSSRVYKISRRKHFEQKRKCDDFEFVCDNLEKNLKRKFDRQNVGFS